MKCSCSNPKEKTVHVDVVRRCAMEKKSKENEDEWLAHQSHSAMHNVSKIPYLHSTLVPSLRFYADPWLVVQTWLASSGQSEINVDDSNHAV